MSTPNTNFVLGHPTFIIMLTQRIIDCYSGWRYLADDIGCCCEKVDLEILSASQFRGFILSLNLFNEGPPDKSIGKCPLVADLRPKQLIRQFWQFESKI